MVHAPSEAKFNSAYYLQVVEHLFKENCFATGRFVALGRVVNLAELRCPLFLLAAQNDDVVAPGRYLRLSI